jgi:methylenetetrahydrofolate dehydrogenase (NAD+)
VIPDARSPAQRGDLVLTASRTDRVFDRLGSLRSGDEATAINQQVPEEKTTPCLIHDIFSSTYPHHHPTMTTSETKTETPLIVASTTGGIKVDAAVVAKPFRREIQDKVKAWKEQGVDAPLLVGLLANTDPAAKKYAEWTGKACRNDGLRYELRTVDDPIDMEATLVDANDDPRVHGIIVYYPIFGQEESFSGASQDDYLRDTVSYKCDVEGLCHLYRTNLYRNIRFLDYPRNQQKCLLPCTALSVVKILEKCPGCYDPAKPIGKHMEAKVVSVINRSEIVGRPLAAMLANDGASVYSIDINSIYLFQGGRLHKCPEGTTPETCVRKVSKKEKKETLYVGLLACFSLLPS